MTLYINNIHPKMTERKLTKIFQKFGKVCSVVMAKEIKSGVYKAYGYVEMTNNQEAKMAISRLNGSIHKRSKISVLPATVLKNTKLIS